MNNKQSILKFHFSDFSVKDLHKKINEAKRLGATNYDIVANVQSHGSLSSNYIEFYRILTKEELIQNEIDSLTKKIELLKK